MNLRELFPEALINDETSMGQNWLTLETEGQFIHFPLESLSQREQALLETQSLSAANLELTEDVWSQYLLQKKGNLPQKLETVQLIYMEHPNRLSPDLLELYQGLLPNLTAVLQAGRTRTILLLDQEQEFEVTELIQDILPTVENDFGTKLTIFFGNSWTKLQNDELRQVFDSENQLFSDFIRYKSSEQTISFAQMLLWAKSRQLDMGMIPAKLLHLIGESRDMEDIIEAMWQSQANLVQTAQKLFMHRNSLQYKLDKFHKLSGLNLKNLDDLAFCHLLLLTD